jgi:hypothetical protein
MHRNRSSEVIEHVNITLMSPFFQDCLQVCLVFETNSGRITVTRVSDAIDECFRVKYTCTSPCVLDFVAGRPSIAASNV